MRGFFSVKFTKVNDGDDKTHVLNKQLRYVCAVTGDALGMVMMKVFEGINPKLALRRRALQIIRH